MSARTAARRHHLRSAAAAAVVAAVAGTALMPLSAYAAPAPGAGNQHALKITMGAPAPSGPLTRGGATESFELTVTNPSDKPHSYHPWILGTPAGASPLQKADVVFKVEGVTAPATESLVLQQGGEWQGMFHAAGKPASEGFEIPAGAKLTWKVTIGLGKGYPTNDGDFTLRPTTYADEAAEGADTGTLTFTTDPAVKAGKLETWFDRITPCQDKAGEYQCREMDLRYRATGDGEFSTALATALDMSLADGTSAAAADVRLQMQADGQWKDLTDKDDYRLPVIPKGFGAASGERVVHLRAKLGPQSKLKKETTVTLNARTGLAEGNTHQVWSAAAKFQVAPATTGTGATGTTPSPAPSTSATARPSTGATASSPASATPVAAGTTTKATGSLATTGAGSGTGLYAGLAAVLVALGGAAAWLGARRRRATRA